MGRLNKRERKYVVPAVGTERPVPTVSVHNGKNQRAFGDLLSATNVVVPMSKWWRPEKSRLIAQQKKKKKDNRFCGQLDPGAPILRVSIFPVS